MSLAEKISADFAAAFKAGETQKKEVLALVKSALNNYKIDNKLEKLSDDDALKVLAKEHKSRIEAAAEFKKGGADDRAAQEEAEAKILEEYLPEQMSEADVEKIVAEVIESSGAKTPQEMGKVMGQLSGKLKGQADMKKVNELVRKKLAG